MTGGERPERKERQDGGDTAAEEGWVVGGNEEDEGEDLWV